MTEIDQSKPVAVTGGAGYIASWIIKYLLEDGRAVRASVRDRSNENKVGHLLKLAAEFPGKLELFEADLLADGGFTRAFKDCELVMHTASPFQIGGVKDAQKQLVDPALKGTRNVLNAATKTGTVKRIVLTSSVAAIVGDNCEAESLPDGTYTEEHWNESSNLKYQPYPYSKVIAEKEAWRLAGEQSNWDLIVINPSFVLGPSLSSRMDGESVNFMRRLVRGDLRTGVPDLTMGVVDVRDVARAHVLAGFRPDASGRHIVSAEMMTMLDIANKLREKFGKNYKLPGGTLPKALVYLVGPLFGLSWRWVGRNIGYRFKLDNSRGKTRLGIEYRPTGETLIEAVDQMEATGII